MDWDLQQTEGTREKLPRNTHQSHINQPNTHRPPEPSGREHTHPWSSLKHTGREEAPCRTSCFDSGKERAPLLPFRTARTSLTIQTGTSTMHDAHYFPTLKTLSFSIQYNLTTHSQEYLFPLITVQDLLEVHDLLMQSLVSGSSKLFTSDYKESKTADWEKILVHFTLLRAFKIHLL